jgi:hypothetical protein
MEGRPWPELELHGRAWGAHPIWKEGGREERGKGGAFGCLGGKGLRGRHGGELRLILCGHEVLAVLA